MNFPYGRLRQKITRERAAALVVTLAPLVYFFPVVRGRLILCPDEGIIFNVPLRVAAAQIFLDGSLPLWNPYLFGGMPLFASAQAGILFPLNWFYFFLPAQAAATAMTLSAYVVAALGAFLYARRSGSSVAGAAVTSLVWQSGGFLVAQIGHVNVVHTAALVPWLLWAVETYAARGERRSAVILAALVAAQTFAGHQQTQIYALVLVAAYAVVMSRGVADGERAVGRRYLKSLIFLAVGLLLSSVQILPTLELTRNSVRASATYDFFSSFSLPPRMLAQFFAPYLFGGGDGGLFRAPYTGQAFYNEYIGYVGLTTLALAALAPALRRDRRTIFWGAAALICLALAVGRFLPFDVYKIVYQIPILNLFRVPARHLMEVNFALAVLAGRGVTFLAGARDRKRAVRLALVAGATVAVLACLAVTVWRPADFRLGRVGPVSFLRAPELFLPVALALAGAWALWYFARGGERRDVRSVAPLLAVLVLDLCLWGQSSGWRLSPTPAHPIWRAPKSVKMLDDLQKRDGGAAGSHRILTDVQPFFVNTGRDEEEKFKLGDFMMSLQPDTYMMHRVENAAGYDGFGLKRYSALAGDMKLWGELTDPARSVRGPGREFDILNVRYLVRQSAQGEARRRAAARAPLAPARAADASRADTVSFGGVSFAKEDLGAPSLVSGERLVFSVPAVEANRVALVTSLSWSADLRDGETVGRVRLRAEDGRRFEFELRAGEHSSEWAHDRPDLRAKIRHRRASVATSFNVEDPAGNFEGHTYVAAFALPATAKLTGGEIEVAAIEGAPKLTLDVKRASLVKDDVAEPLRGEWVEKFSAAEGGTESEGTAAGATAGGGGRWRLAAEDEYLLVYENTHALPRAWLAGQVVLMSDEEILQTIRTGHTPDGRVWNPRESALVNPPQAFKMSADATGDAAGEAKITRHEPNRVDVSVSAKSPGVLVVGENHYPGWRAYLDGEPVETLRVNYNLRGVVVPPGAHEVRFYYRPKSVMLGLLVSLLAAAGLVVWWRRWLPGSRIFGSQPQRGEMR